MAIKEIMCIEIKYCRWILSNLILYFTDAYLQYNPEIVDLAHAKAWRHAGRCNTGYFESVYRNMQENVTNPDQIPLHV